MASKFQAWVTRRMIILVVAEMVLLRTVVQPASKSSGMFLKLQTDDPTPRISDWEGRSAVRICNFPDDADTTENEITELYTQFHIELQLLLLLVSIALSKYMYYFTLLTLHVVLYYFLSCLPVSLDPQVLEVEAHLPCLLLLSKSKTWILSGPFCSCMQFPSHQGMYRELTSALLWLPPFQNLALISA